MAKNSDQQESFVSELRGRIKAHYLPIFAAAMAFFGFIAIVPALAATVSITALVADETQLISEAEAALASAPTETQEFLVGQLRSIVASDSGGVGLAAVSYTHLTLPTICSV